MKTLLVIFLLLLFLLIFIISKNLEISQTGEFIKSNEKTNSTSDVKWKIIARVEIMNGKIVNVTRNIS
ncbi:MAG: hypothetical protein QXL86_02610 [Candidatus Aenigmatarchaeota archaeon]